MNQNLIKEAKDRFDEEFGKWFYSPEYQGYVKLREVTKDFIASELSKAYMQALEDNEIVICAAVKCQDGTLIRCHRHSDGYDKLHDMKKPLAEREEGFMTSTNRFVDQTEGLKLQLKAGIISK